MIGSQFTSSQANQRQSDSMHGFCGALRRVSGLFPVVVKQEGGKCRSHSWPLFAAEGDSKLKGVNTEETKLRIRQAGPDLII